MNLFGFSDYFSEYWIAQIYKFSKLCVVVFWRQILCLWFPCVSPFIFVLRIIWRHIWLWFCNGGDLFVDCFIVVFFKIFCIFVRRFCRCCCRGQRGVGCVVFLVLKASILCVGRCFRVVIRYFSVASFLSDWRALDHVLPRRRQSYG